MTIYQWVNAVLSLITVSLIPCFVNFLQAILCTKEIGEKARSASYLLLVEMGHAKIRWNKDVNGQWMFSRVCAAKKETKEWPVW